MGEALAYIAKYSDGLGRCLTDGRVELRSNIAERMIRPIALNRKTPSSQAMTLVPKIEPLLPPSSTPAK